MQMSALVWAASTESNLEWNRGCVLIPAVSVAQLGDINLAGLRVSIIMCAQAKLAPPRRGDLCGAAFMLRRGALHPT